MPGRAVGEIEVKSVIEQHLSGFPEDHRIGFFREHLQNRVGKLLSAAGPRKRAPETSKRARRTCEKQRLARHSAQGRS